VPKRIALIFVLPAVFGFAIGFSRVSGQEAAPPLAPAPSGPGLHLATWSSGTIDEAVAATPELVSIWVAVDGGMVGYLARSPAFVNVEFLTRFPDGRLPEGMPVLVVTRAVSRICGIEVIELGFAGRTIRDDARDCFLSAFERAHPAQIAVMRFSPEGDGVSRLLTVVPDGVEVIEAELAGFRASGQNSYLCSEVEFVGDIEGFALAGCSDVALPEVVFCGFELIVHSPDHFNLEARRCLLDAFERGMPARFITTAYSVEGAPSSMMLTIDPPGRVEVFEDSQDSLSSGPPPAPRRFTFSCYALEPLDPEQPAVFRLQACTDG
jgi:hypothetical protein